MSSIFDPSLESLHPDDFKGLTAIPRLLITDTALDSLPAGIFSDLQSVTDLSLPRNRLETVEANAFEGLIGMTDLSLNSNPRLEIISPDAFEGLSALQTLNLHQTRISTLPSGVFDGLSSVETLGIWDTPLVNLPQGVFDPLTALSRLDLNTNSELVSLPSRTFVNNANLGRLRLDTNPKLASLPDEMFSSGHTLIDVNINGTAIETLPANFIAALGSIEALDLPSTLTAWPTGFDLPDTLSRLKIRGNETFHTLPDDVLSAPLPQSLTSLRFYDIRIPDETLDAIGAHQAVDIYDGADPPPPISWYEFHVTNTGITGADVTDLINGWCYNDAACPDWNGPRRFFITNEDLSDWLDPDGDPTTLEEHRAAVRNMALQGAGQLFLNNTRMSAAQVTELLTHIPKDMDTISLINLDLDGLEIGPSTFTFAEFTLLYELRIINSGIGDATAKKIIDDLPAEIVRFSLASNNVRTVPVFPTYEYLQYLYLHQNPLETVTAGAFDNLPYVFVISLDFGELESIPAGIFDNNVELDTVYLNNNMLSELPAGLFDKNPYLYEVYLEYNMLSDLPVGLFDYNPLLSILILNDNQLTDLPADLLHEIVEQHAVSGLRVIDLSNNLFTELPDGFFDGREYLRELDLGNNRLTSLPDFKDSVRLEVLNLQGNEFEQMLTDFPYLKRLLTFNGVETVRAPADEAQLRSLELSRVPLGETFDRANEMYMATTAAGETTVTATPLDPDATTVIKLNGTVDADGTVDLELGSNNVITVEVTAEDGTTKKTYTVTVTREAPDAVPAPRLPSVDDPNAIWLATLTVEDLGSNQYGYNVEEGNLTDTAFTYLGDNASISSNSHFEDWGTLYTIDELAYSAGNFYLSLGRQVRAR